MSLTFVRSAIQKLAAMFRTEETRNSSIEKREQAEPVNAHHMLHKKDTSRGLALESSQFFTDLPEKARGLTYHKMARRRQKAGCERDANDLPVDTSLGLKTMGIALAQLFTILAHDVF